MSLHCALTITLILLDLSICFAFVPICESKSKITRSYPLQTYKSLLSTTTPSKLHCNKNADASTLENLMIKMDRGISTDVQDRRKMLTSTSFTAVSCIALTTIPSAPSNAAQTAGESIRRSAANIPGYGQPDIFYPPYFLGKWKARREIVVSDDMYLQNIVPVVIEYDVRFIPVDGDSSDSPDKVVSDRGYNEASFQAALLSVIEKSGSKKSPPPIRSFDWVSTNPNVLTLSYTDGTSREIKVTKRAATIGPDQETVSSSEYRRLSDVGARGIPILSASRVLTKWKKGETANTNEAASVIEGIEIVYDEGMMGDPMGGASGPGGGGGGPKVSSKSRIRLERL